MNRIDVPSIVTDRILNMPGVLLTDFNNAINWQDGTENPMRVDMFPFILDKGNLALAISGLTKLLTPEQLSSANAVYASNAMEAILATKIALLHNIPIILRHNDEFFKIDVANLRSHTWIQQRTQAVIGVTLIGTVLATYLSEIWNVPLLNHRAMRTTKDYSQIQEIVGSAPNDSRVSFIMPPESMKQIFSDYYSQISSKLESPHLSHETNIYLPKEYLKSVDTLGDIKNIIFPKESISTGYKLLREVQFLKQLGVKHIMPVSIFHYYFQATKDAFLKSSVSPQGIASFEMLMKLARIYKLFDDEQFDQLQNWHKDRALIGEPAR